MWFRLFLVSAVLALAGCSTFPDPIKLENDTNLLSYEQASAQPDYHLGRTVRWGGVIANVSNLPDATLVEMVYYPLRSYGRPIVGDESMGRYRFYVDGFLDPMVFQTGRSLTIVGEYIGTEEGSVGEHKYVFPTIQASSYYLWKEVDRVEVSSVYVWPYGSFMGWPHYRPYHQRVIIRRTPDRATPSQPVSPPPTSANRPVKPSHVTNPKPPVKDYK